MKAAAAEAAGFQTIQVDDQDALIIVAALAELDDEQREALKRRAMSLLAEARARQQSVNHGNRRGKGSSPRDVAADVTVRRDLSPDNDRV